MQVSPQKYVILILMSLIGLTSSIYVLYEFYTLGKPLPFCTMPNQVTTPGAVTINCTKVLLSTYSDVNILGTRIHLELLAAVWFIINLILVTIVTFASERTARKFLDLLFGWRFFGLLLVPYLIYLELYVLHAICTYCTIMHAAIIIDFIIISYYLFSKHSPFYIKKPAEKYSNA
ncbi:MAG: vitamin K epoxide reductase family protein [Candidatus Micrarchaeia archaeon]